MEDTDELTRAQADARAPYAVKRLYNADGLIGLRGDLAVRGVDLDAPLAAEENDAFIEYTETGDGFCVRDAFAGDTVKVGDVYRIVPTVERDLLDVYPGIEQLGAFRADAEGVFYVALRRPRRKHTQILYAVLIPAAGVYFLRMDTNSLANACAAVHRTGYDPVCHIGIPPLTKFSTVYARAAPMCRLTPFGKSDKLAIYKYEERFRWKDIRTFRKSWI